MVRCPALIRSPTTPPCWIKTVKRWAQAVTQCALHPASCPVPRSCEQHPGEKREPAPLARLPLACPHLCGSVFKSFYGRTLAFVSGETAIVPEVQMSVPQRTEQCVSLFRGQPAASSRVPGPRGSWGSAELGRKVPEGLSELQTRERQGLRQTKGNKEISKRRVWKQ